MLKSRLPQISFDLARRMDDVADDGAAIIAQAARERVPVRSGDLRDAIHTEDGPDGSYVIAGNARVFYGHIVEHGSSHAPPHPFLIPALEENRDNVRALAAAKLRGL